MCSSNINLEMLEKKIAENEYIVNWEEDDPESGKKGVGIILLAGMCIMPEPCLFCEERKKELAIERDSAGTRKKDEEEPEKPEGIIERYIKRTGALEKIFDKMERDMVREYIYRDVERDISHETSGICDAIAGILKKCGIFTAVKGSISVVLYYILNEDNTISICARTDIEEVLEKEGVLSTELSGMVEGMLISYESSFGRRCRTKWEEYIDDAITNSKEFETFAGIVAGVGF